MYENAKDLLADGKRSCRFDWVAERRNFTTVTYSCDVDDYIDEGVIGDYFNYANVDDDDDDDNECPDRHCLPKSWQCGGPCDCVEIAAFVNGSSCQYSFSVHCSFIGKSIEPKLQR
ncbi:hypothetical protein RUM44_009460 [Polyplax serrata]|uniref:Uncharacterized protein n=1 Tax=Polyplax serrata TaxID=468196 RepID=A0ABR1ASR3_POLSC